MSEQMKKIAAWLFENAGKANGSEVVVHDGEIFSRVGTVPLDPDDYQLEPEVGAPELRIKKEHQHNFSTSWSVPLEPTKWYDFETHPLFRWGPPGNELITVHRLDDPEELWDWMRLLNANYTTEQMTRRRSICIPISYLEVVPGGTRW